MKKRTYCVDIYYKCSAHYVVEAKDKEEAYEKASEMNRNLPSEEWYKNLDIEWDFTHDREEN